MLREVRCAARFLRDIIGRKGHVSSKALDTFSSRLEQLLCNKYRNHWHPEKPILGSGWRCLSITHKDMDPLVATAASESGVGKEVLLQTLPSDLTVWIDPDEVSYRIGVEGSICVLQDALKELSQPKETLSESIKSTNSSPTEVPYNCRVDASVLGLGRSKIENSTNSVLQECASS